MSDPRHKPGSHWVALYFDVDGNGEYFCSYGRKPERDIAEFLLKNSQDYYSWNQKGIQGPSSATCGNYAIYYLLHRAQGLSACKIVDRFGKDKIKNDCLAALYINQKFRIKTECHPDWLRAL